MITAEDASIMDDNEIMEESRVWRILATPCRRLDQWFTLQPDEQDDANIVLEPKPIMPETIGPAVASDEDQIIPTIKKHAYMPYWDDLPSPSRMQSYAHQPWYEDNIDVYLWLPRDPMSTLDLEDTIESEFWLCFLSAVTFESNL